MLDLDNTIFNYEKTEEYALKKLFQKYSLKYLKSYRNEYSRINSGLWKQYEQGTICAEDLRLERFLRLLDFAGFYDVREDIVRFSNDYLFFLSEKVFFEPYAKSIYKYLKSRYKVLFFTNGIHSVQKKRLVKAGFLEDESDLVSSEIARASKPSERIFEYAFNKAGILNKEKVIIIGDGLRSDIKGANISGIDCIWYNRKGKEKNENVNINIDYEIKSLNEIRSIL